jgi:putative CRISPR-associated protein (TIGR02619 family)
MRRAIFSTIGTSLLTNQINRADSNEKNWYSQLRDTANFSKESIQQHHPEVLAIIQTLESRALSSLSHSEIKTNRASSAEINGIYGLYQEQLSQGVQDIHWLIATDTVQGKATAEIVEAFLKTQSLNNVNTYVVPGLTTVSTSSFADGIDNLIAWMRTTIPAYKESNYKICFNLVGSFKSLQGYLNTIGMFYADEIIYIFEGKESELITIPRLPIAIDLTVIEPYKVSLALMDAGIELSINDTQGISEALIYVLDNTVTLSTWGKLIWGECKQDILGQELLQLPRLKYRDSFKADYKAISQKHERIKLQETLIEVSSLLITSNGRTTDLQGGGLQYTRYTNSDRIDHFRVDKSQRVSCESLGGELLLRHYGSHAHVEGKL